MRLRETNENKKQTKKQQTIYAKSGEREKLHHLNILSTSTI